MRFLVLTESAARARGLRRAAARQHPAELRGSCARTAKLRWRHAFSAWSETRSARISQ